MQNAALKAKNAAIQNVADRAKFQYLPRSTLPTRRANRAERSEGSRGRVSPSPSGEPVGRATGGALAPKGHASGRANAQVGQDGDFSRTMAFGEMRRSEAEGRLPKATAKPPARARGERRFETRLTAPSRSLLNPRPNPPTIAYALSHQLLQPLRFGGAVLLQMAELCSAYFNPSFAMTSCVITVRGTTHSTASVAFE